MLNYPNAWAKLYKKISSFTLDCHLMFGVENIYILKIILYNISMYNIHATYYYVF